MNKFTVVVILIAVTVGIAGFYYYQNFFSKGDLRLEILGQEEADLLDEVKYIVKYKNNGNTELEEPELIFEFPQYSILENGGNGRITKNSEELGGTIYPGEERTITFKARLLGKEGEAKEAKATFSYRPKNLKTRYPYSTVFITVIKKVPLTFEFDLPSKIDSGKELKFRLNYFSNTDYPLPNLMAQVDYPADFEFVKSVPNSLDQSEWDIGLLNKAEGGRVEITGKLRGGVGEEKVFYAKLGSWQNGEFVLLKEAARGINIIKPSLYITQYINNSPEFIADPGDYLHYEIYFRNIGEDTLTDMNMQISLVGSAFDFNTLRAMGGVYEVGDSSVLWDWRSVSDLQLLYPQEEGKIEFWINLKDSWEIKDINDKNPTIKTNIYLSQVKEEFINKVNSKMEISQRAFFEDEVFGNTGPIPPQVGQNTTYTVIWQAKNYYSEMKNVKVKATLPQSVRLSGQIFPEEEEGKLTFDSDSRELVWNIGDMLVAQGVANQAPNIAFQVSFYPSPSQVGRTAQLISQAEISGQDQWTNEILAAQASAVDSSLPDDPNVSLLEGIVQ
ncbi:MAG: hypothetical protein ABH831_01140 [Candidatus Nealsonbacteria bacterium]